MANRQSDWTGHLDLIKDGLHARLGIAPGRPIPESALREAMRSAERRHDLHEEHQVEFAEAAKGFRHHGS